MDFGDRLFFIINLRTEKVEKNKVSAHSQIYQKQNCVHMHIDSKAHKKTDFTGWRGDLEPVPEFTFGGRALTCLEVAWVCLF